MYAHFRYLDGPRQGETRALAQDFATIGRDPSADLPFDAADELQVSVRHAAIFKQGGGFLVRDLGSTNGTYLNGKRVRGDRPLEVNDVLQFGPTGPRIEFTTAATLPAAARLRSPAATPAPRPSEIIRPKPRTTERMPAAPGSPPRSWKGLAAAALLVAAAAAAVTGWRWYQAREELGRRQVALLARTDSLLSRLGTVQPAAAGLAAGLLETRRGIDSIRTLIGSDPVAADRLGTLATLLDDGAARRETLLAAAAFDPAAAAGAAGAAVVLVVAEFGTGRVTTGTGFAIRELADTVWVVTASGVVQDSLGGPAIRVAVIFNGSRHPYRARVGRINDSAGVALITAWARGGAPAVAALAPTASAGDPVALTGFPSGLDSSGTWRTRGTAATPATGTITEAGPDRLGIDGYGARVSNGSPIFARNGTVVGVVSGTGPRLTAVPAGRIQALLQSGR